MTKGYHFEDELYPSVASVDVGRAVNTLWDQESSPKKFTRTISFAGTPEMYQAIQELAANRHLPFNGSLAEFERAANAAFIEALDEYLDEDVRSIFRSLMAQQRRLTRERVIVTIDEIVDQQVEQLRFWTHRSKWREIVRQLKKFHEELAEYPQQEWREYAADVWLHHTGVKQIMRLWSERMVSESPTSWEDVRKFTDAMEAYAIV